MDDFGPWLLSYSASLGTRYFKDILIQVEVAGDYAKPSSQTELDNLYSGKRWMTSDLGYSHILLVGGLASGYINSGDSGGGRLRWGFETLRSIMRS